MSEEHVLAVKRSELPADWLMEQGGTLVSGPDLLRHAQGWSSEWLPRRQAEGDPTYKQIIPYIVVRDHEGRVACYPRQGSETRLHGLWSAGVGGHVNPADEGCDLLETLFHGARRELSEEFTTMPRCVFRVVGVINEEITPVGAVHLGVVIAAGLLPGALRPEPAAELRGLQWLDGAGRAKRELEIWSNLALALVAVTQ